MKDTRLVVYKGVAAGTLALLALSLFDLQVLHGSYYRRLSERNRIRLIRVVAPRGIIQDRQGVPLASTRPSLDVFIVPEDFSRESVPFLARTLGISSEAILSKINDPEDPPFVPVLLKRDVAKEVVFRLEERKPGLGGVFVEVQGLRYYPHGAAASHVVGYLGKITQEEYTSQEEKLYDRNDWLGRSGIEKLFDAQLQGEDGGKQIEVNARGRQVRVLGEREPVPGSRIVLTIDRNLEEKIGQILAGRKGSVCVLDLKKGEVLALVSKPDFDPNIFVSPSQSAERIVLVTDEADMPLLNRAASAGFPPGSVFKLITATAALEMGKIKPETTFNCRGSFRLSPRSRPFKCWREGGHGYVNFYQAIEQSCNVYFYQVGMRVGVKQLARYSRELGLGKLVEVELTNLSEGMIPDEEWKRQRFHDAWYEGETLNFAIGQGFVLTTPLQIARLVGLIATGGDLPQLHLVMERVSPDGRMVRTPVSRRRRLAVSAENISHLRQAMLRVVQSDRGTGQLARVDFLRVAAKTGTAQVPLKDPHSWFSGFFPYEDPRFALVVMIEHGGPGGYVAARLAKDIILKMQELRILEGGSYA